MKKKKMVVLTGAGISAESGISTFRDANGLWEGHDVMEVASVEGFERNPALVLDFYNKRRRQLKAVNPNKAHHILKALEEDFAVSIITQNVDDLHERAGSTHIIHLHGKLLKARGVQSAKPIYHWEKDILPTDRTPTGERLRPHIVWFGEEVPEMSKAMEEIQKADVVVVIGTSLQVYPAAGLLDFAPPKASIFYIDPHPAKTTQKIKIIAKKATEGLEELLEILKKEHNNW